MSNKTILKQFQRFISRVTTENFFEIYFISHVTIALEENTKISLNVHNGGQLSPKFNLHMVRRNTFPWQAPQGPR